MLKTLYFESRENELCDSHLFYNIKNRVDFYRYIIVHVVIH